VQRDCGVLGEGHVKTAVRVAVGIGCEKADVRGRSSQIKQNVNGAVRVWWTSMEPGMRPLWPL